MRNTYTAGGLGFLYKKSIFSATTSLKSPFPAQNALKKQKFSPLAKKRSKFFAPSARAMFCGGGGRAAIIKNAKHQNTYTAGVVGFLYKKSIFSTTTSLKSPFPVQKMTKKNKKKSPSAKKKLYFYFAPAALYRCDPGGGGAIEFLNSRILGFCPYT